MIKNQIIILKNDAVGDLVHSLNAIDNIINNHTDHKIIIYLSERSKKFSCNKIFSKTSKNYLMNEYITRQSDVYGRIFSTSEKFF